MAKQLKPAKTWEEWKQRKPLGRVELDKPQPKPATPPSNVVKQGGKK